MSCKNCKSIREALQKSYTVMLDKFIPERQLKARLTTFKLYNCKECDSRYKCDLILYNKCIKSG